MRKSFKLDWRAYFVEFCRVHGEPIEFKGRLLFADGWTYSITDHSGPEWPPPKDFKELDLLVTSYYVARRSKLMVMLTGLLAEQSTLVEAIATHSLPLMQTIVEGEGEDRRRVAVEVDVTDLDTKIQWVRDDLEECDERLKELEAHGAAA